MGTNSKSSHQSYITAPTATVDEESSLAALAADALASLAPPPVPEPAPAPEGAPRPQEPTAPDNAPAGPFDPEAMTGAEGPASGAATLPPEELIDEPQEPSADAAADVEAQPEPEPVEEEPVTQAQGLEEPQAMPSDEPAGEWQDALTPLPEQLPLGEAFGIPVMVSGLELEGSALTLMSYVDGEGSREVLTATVSPEAEAALLDALSSSGTKMVTVESIATVQERLQLDKDLGIAEKIAQAAKSVNHKLKNGTEIPQHTLDYLQEAVAAMDTAATSTLSGPESAQQLTGMLAHYQSTIDAIQTHLDGNGLPYTEGGKIPLTTAYLHPTTKTVTTEVPAPVGEAEPGVVPSSVQKASRIQASVDAEGKVHWNGSDRELQNTGSEYALDLGDGYSAVYRPHEAPNGHAPAPYSMRGQLEIVAPAGAGHGEHLVGKLAALNLSAAPATAAEGELAYLKANVSAQELGKKAEVAAAMNAGAHLAEMHVQELFHAEGHRAVGLDAQGLSALAREFQARAARAAIPAHTALLRDAVAKATGHGSGDALASSPGYQPAPAANAGWLTWSRFDVTGNPGAVSDAFAGRALIHTGDSDKIVSMLRSGVLASTERRRSMGIPNVGQSEGEDMDTGGAKSVFLRVADQAAINSPGHYRISVVWGDPVTVMSDASAYGFNSDKFGVVNPDHGKFAKPVRSPQKIAGFSSSGNEVMFAHGIDLRGPAGPTGIVTGTDHDRTRVLATLKAQSVTHLGELPIEQAVTVKGLGS